MSVNIGQFRSEVYTDAMNCPVPLVDRAIRHAAIEFCEYTLTWREEIESQRVRANQSDYDLEVPTCARVVTVIYAGHNGVRLIPSTEKTLDTEQDGWRTSTNTATDAAWYYLPDRETIRLALTPSTSARNALAIACAFKPTQDATTLPDTLYNDHLEAIGFGAKARILAMPGKDWSNPNLAVYYKTEFEMAKRKEKAERLNDYTRESTFRVRPINYYG